MDERLVLLAPPVAPLVLHENLLGLVGIGDLALDEVAVVQNLPILVPAGQPFPRGVGQSSRVAVRGRGDAVLAAFERLAGYRDRSEEHTSELQSLMRISYAV